MFLPDIDKFYMTSRYAKLMNELEDHSSVCIQYSIQLLASQLRENRTEHLEIFLRDITWVAKYKHHVRR